MESCGRRRQEVTRSGTRISHKGHHKDQRLRSFPRSETAATRQAQTNRCCKLMLRGSVHVHVRICVHIIGDREAGIGWAWNEACAAPLFAVSLLWSDGAEIKTCGWLSLIQPKKRLSAVYHRSTNKKVAAIAHWQDCR